MSAEAAMPPADPRGPVRPDFETPKTFGILNIVFAAALMACGLCQDLTLAAPSLLTMATIKITTRAGPTPSAPAPATPSDPGVEPFSARLDRLEARTTDPKARAVIAAAREADRVASAPRKALAEFPVERLRDPRIVGHLVLDLATGLMLNVLMLVAGVGLVFTKRWGGFLSILVAWLKIARLLALAIAMTWLVAPAAASLVDALDAGLDAPATGPLGPGLRLSLAAWAWVMFLLGSIYPACTIAFLNRRAVREALSAA